MEKYKPIRVIGKGSFGQAVLCKHRRTGASVVMKRINMRSLDRPGRTAALQEVKILAAVSHPAIIRHYESFEQDGMLCIVTEFAGAGDMARVLKKRRGAPISEDRILGWAAELLSALRLLHSRRMLHRDLKLGNVFLSSSFKVKLGDFGIARILKHTAELAKTVVGTPLFMAPEIFENKPYNHKSDVWSVGCCLYELATQRHAFQADTLPELVRKVVSGSIAPIPETYSPKFRQLVALMLSRHPSRRPSAAQLLPRHDGPLDMPNEHASGPREAGERVLDAAAAFPVLRYSGRAAGHGENEEAAEAAAQGDTVPTERILDGVLTSDRPRPGDEAGHRFVLDGRTIRLGELPTRRAELQQTPATGAERLEALRCFLESRMGEDVFFRVYRQLLACAGGSVGAAQTAALGKTIKSALRAVGHEPLADVVEQLILAERSLFVVSQ